MSLWGDAWKGARWRNRNVPPALGLVLFVIVVAAIPLMKCLKDHDDSERHEQFMAEQEQEEAEDAQLIARLRPRFAKLVEVETGPDERCGSEVKRVAVVQQAWLAYFLANRSYEQRPPEPRMGQSRSLEQLTTSMRISGRDRLARNQRYLELEQEPYIAVVIAKSVTPIVEGKGERGPSQFSAGRLEGQIVIVDVATNAVACRMPIVVETPAFQYDRSKEGVLGDWTVIETPWSEPFWKAADAALAKASIHGASFARD